MATENDNSTYYVGYDAYRNASSPTSDYIASYQGYDRPTEGLLPNGMFNELSTGIGYAFSSTTRPWPNYVNIPEGHNQAPGLYEWISKKQFSDSRLLSYDIDAKNTEQTVAVAVEKIAKTLGLKLSDPLLNTIRKMAYTVAEYSPYIKDIVGRVVKQLAQEDDSFKNVANQISDVLDMLVGPTGPTSILESSMERSLSPYMGAYNANAIISEFIAKEYAPGSDGKTVSRMTTTEMSSLINFMSNKGTKVFNFNDNEINKNIRDSLNANPNTNVLSTEETARLQKSQIRRASVAQREAVNKGWAMTKAINSLGNISDSDKKAISSYVTAAESASGLKHSIYKTLAANNSSNTEVDLLTTEGTEAVLSDLNSIRQNIVSSNVDNYAESEQYKQVEKSIKDITAYKKLQAAAYQAEIKDNNNSTVDTSAAINSLFSPSNEKETIENIYTKQLTDYYTTLSEKFKTNESTVTYDIGEVVQAKKDIATLQRYGYTYKDFEGEEGADRLKTLSADERVDPELIATIKRLNEDTITKYSSNDDPAVAISKAKNLDIIDAEADKLINTETDATVKKYNEKLIQLEKAKEPDTIDKLREEIAALEGNDTIRQYRAIIASRDGSLRMEKMASSYKIFKGALAATRSESNRSNMNFRNDGDVFKAMDMITQGSITRMSAENFTEDINTISSLMVESGANIDTTLQFSGLAAQTAISFGGDRQKAGVLGAKVGLAVMTHARQMGLSNASMLGSAAAKLAGKAETSYISKGVSGLLQYMEANPDKLDTITGPEGEILKKLKNNEQLSTDEIMLIQKEGFLDRLGEKLGMSDAERYNMFQQTYVNTDVGDTVAIQAGMQSKYGMDWATDYVDAISSGNKNLASVLGGGENANTRAALMDFALKNPSLLQSGNEAKLKEALLERFKGDDKMTAIINNPANMPILRDMLYGGANIYAKRVNAPSVEDASNAYTAASFLTTGLTTGKLWGAINDEASKHFSGFTKNVSAALRDNPNLSFVELWQQGAGIKDLSDPVERAKATSLAAVYSLGFSYEKTTGDIKGLSDSITKKAYTAAQNSVQTLAEAGLLPLFLKVKNGTATNDEVAKFKSESKKVLNQGQLNDLNTVLDATQTKITNIVSQAKPTDVNGKPVIAYTGKTDETKAVTEEDTSVESTEASPEAGSTIVSSEESISAEPEASPIVANVSESGAGAAAQSTSSNVSVSESASAYDEASDAPITTKATLVSISKEAVTAIVEAIQPIVG